MAPGFFGTSTDRDLSKNPERAGHLCGFELSYPNAIYPTRSIVYSCPVGKNAGWSASPKDYKDIWEQQHISTSISSMIKLWIDQLKKSPQQPTRSTRTVPTSRLSCNILHRFKFQDHKGPMAGIRTQGTATGCGADLGAVLWAEFSVKITSF